MSAKIAKTLARQQERIAEGNYYEAHQQLRVVATRYLKASDYASAARVLGDGALLLLKANQSGSGSDLALMLLHDVYNGKDSPFQECTQDNKQGLLNVLEAFPADEPNRKRFINDMISWSSSGKNAERFPYGDPDLHHAAGALYAASGDAYDAERHLLLGTSASAPLLASLHYAWYTLDSPHTAALYASRAILPYLTLGNLGAATRALAQFTSLLTTSNPTLPTQSIDSSKSSLRIFPSLPLLNFLSLLVLASAKADRSLFTQLGKHYSAHLKEVNDLWAEALANIGEVWFGIRIPKQGGGNPLFDMMSSMMFGGGGRAGGGSSGSGSTPRAGTPKAKIEAKAPTAMDLD
ncbi:hypothetical protein DV737_g3641, partial [Chaetothyriales sp. CBS 132003]